ncbi:MAG TPA: alpha/beta hydrolase [Rhodoglobus sp.]|nr:alpha/beta hydrolase [Rhodoglobus sp.]
MAVRAPALRRVPVWMWRALMAHLAPRELRRFNANPISDVSYTLDVDYVGDGTREHRLDVIAPRDIPGPLPVYVYFHGGGWTSGDKSALTKYCATQALGGMIVVNANYRMAPRATMQHMMQDAHAVLRWISTTIAEFGGDPDRVVLGGDSAGGQISALLAASTTDAELARHYGLTPVLATVRGVVQHCSAVEFSVMFERGFILSLEFVRMLLPRRDRGLPLRSAAHYLSPIDWVDSTFPPALVTTSRKDPFYQANLNFIAELMRKGVPVESHIDEFADHTWQQDSHHPGSAVVYERLQAFVRRVAPVPVG